MTKAESDTLLADVREIKTALIESEYGPGLIKDHKDTKARTYTNQRAITRFRTTVYAITSSIAFIGMVITIVKNWNSIF